MAEVNKKLLEDARRVAALPLPWERLAHKRILISGASGMIGSFLIHVLMERKEELQIIALGRSEEKAKAALGRYWGRKGFEFLSHDINTPLSDMGKIDFMIHAASNTHPKAYASDPVGTVTTNVLGSINMLEYAAKNGVERFLFASSVEIYGENRGDQDYFDESYCGYIDCNTVRAGYQESKRTGEALCQAYHAKYGIDVVTARLARTYGPTMLKEDSKAIAQFIKNGLNKEDIVLKSEGTQLYSYTYVADAVSGLLTILLKGECGQAYNIADSRSDLTLRALAELIAETAGKKVIFQLPDKLEAAGYSKATKAILDAEKLKKLGWKAEWDIGIGIRRTLEILDDERRAEE